MHGRKIGSDVARSLLRILNRKGPAWPSSKDSFCAPFEHPWHVRTIILPISGPQAPMLFVSNLLVGRVGVQGFFDMPQAMQDPMEDGHLILFAAGREGSTARTFTFSRSKDLISWEEGFRIRHQEMRFQAMGAWPKYEIQLAAPRDDVHVRISIESDPPVHWWAYLGEIYRHYSDLGRVKGILRIGTQETAFNSWISLEHGLGLSPLGLPGRPSVPLSLFHYEMGSLADRGVFALGKASTLGGRLEGLRSGLFVDTEGRRFTISDWGLTTSVVEQIPDRCGGRIEVPREWRVKAYGPGIRLTYHCVEYWKGFAGVGRLCSGGAMISGRVEAHGLPSSSADGVVYQEHLHHGGPVW